MFAKFQRAGQGRFVVLGVSLLLAVLSQAVAAATCTPAAHLFCVTNTNDTTDTGSPNYAGSLRKAIADAAAAGGASNTIDFDIAGAGPHTITLAAGLDLTANLTIDGYSQTGSVQNTNTPDQGGSNAQLMIELVGNGGVGFFRSSTAAVLTWTFQGLNMHGFSTAISGQNGTTTPKTQINVYGCFIGTKVDGTAFASLGNSDSAIRSGFDSAHVGGALAWQRNVLSGNGGTGLLASPSDASSSIVVEGNLIGTDASGTVAIPNGTSSNWPGLYIQGTVRNVRVGCTTGACATHASRNIISGNRPWGIALTPNVGGTPYLGLEIKGNYIGASWNGSALPNGWTDAASAQYGGGIQVNNSSGDSTPAIIGGFGAGEANLIAFNHGPGINALNTGNHGWFDTRANQLHDNSGPGSTNVAIAEFAANEPLANDTDDADAGSNARQNSPEVLTAEPVRQAGQLLLQVTYRVRSAPANSTYPIRVDFHFAVNGGAGLLFAQDSYPSSAGQGYVTSLLPITLAVGGGSPWYSFWGPLVAIATDNAGRSSEVSPVSNDWVFGDDFDGP